MPDQSRQGHITIWNFADWQYGARLVDHALVRKHLSQIKADPKSYFVLGGDNVDAVVMGDKRFTNANLDPELFQGADTRDRILNVCLESQIAILKPLKRKLLGVMDGNHEVAGNKRCQMNYNRILAQQLGVPHLGYETVLAMSLVTPNGNRDGGNSRIYNLRLHHGSGGGATKGGKMTRRITKANDWENVHAHLSGHVHDAVTADPIRLKPVYVPETGEIEIREHPVPCIISGSYLKTRSIEKAEIPTPISDSPFTGYGEMAEYSPVKLGMRGVSLYAREWKVLPVEPERYFREAVIEA